VRQYRTGGCGRPGAAALANALDKVADKLIDLALNALLEGSGGGLRSFLQKIFGFADGGIAAHGKPMKRFVNGGVSRTAAVFG
jgi:hypothetical protein